MRIGLFMAAILAGVTLVGASPAEAQSLTAPGEASVDEITDLLYAGGTTTTRPTPSDPALVEAWRARELALRSEGGSLPSAGSELETLRRFGKVKWGFRILGRASLVATAGQVGWEIGSIIADEIYEEDLPAAAELTGWDPAYSQLMAVQKGDCIAFVDTTQPPTLAGMSDADARTACSGGPGLPDSTEDSSKLRAPADGWVLILREAGGFRDYYTVQFGPGAEGPISARLKPGYSPWDIHSCNEITHPLTAAAPAGFQLLGALTSSGAPWYGRFQSTATCLLEAVSPEVISGRPYVWFKPASGVSRPVAPGEDPPGQPLNGDVPDPGRAVVEQAVRENLCDPEYRQAALFVANQVGQAVCAGQVQLPNCRGKAYTACENDLDEIGVQPHRTTRTVEQVPDDDIDLGAGAVVSLDPAEGSFAQPDDQIDVVTNPERPAQEPEDDGNEQDPDCDHAQGSVPADWDSRAPEFTPAPLTMSSTSALGVDPDVDGSPKPIVLRYGRPIDRWSARHVADRHGWNAAAERDTRLAIAFGYRGFTDGPSWERSRRYTVLLPQRNAGGKVCGRRVIAQLAYNPSDPASYPDVNGREKGIITSFGFALK